MMLKQSTAVVISFGPFLDKTDGVTLETGLVSALDHASTGIMLSKNGGTLAVRHATVTASEYDAHGCYKVTLDTTDTGTLGKLRVIYTDAATCLPVWMDFEVVTAAHFNNSQATSGGQLPNAAADAAGGLPISDAGGLDLDTLLGRLDAAVTSRAAAALFTGITSVAEWLGLIAGKQAGDATAQTEIRATGAGSGTYDPTTDSQEAISDAALDAAAVNAEVVDALAVDTYAEPTGVPAATGTLAAKINRLHQALRNRLDVTATKKTFYDDDDAALWEKDLSDDGSTYSESEANAP